MQGICPDCLSEIPSESVDSGGKWGICERCDGLFPVIDSLSVPMIPLRPQKPGDVRILIERPDEDTLRLIEPPVRGKNGWLFLSSLILFSVLDIVSILGAIFTGELIFIFLAGSLFFILLLFADSTWGFCIRKRTFLFDREKLSISTGKTIPRSHIRGVRSHWAPTQVWPLYNIRILYDKKHLEIVSRSVAEQEWVCAELNDFLESTSPSRLCCPECNRGVPDDFPSDSGGSTLPMKCLWCGKTVDRTEADRIGQEELADPYRGDSDYLRPLESRFKLRQDDNELEIHQPPRGFHGFWERFGVFALSIFALCLLIVFTVFLFSPVGFFRLLALHLGFFVIVAALSLYEIFRGVREEFTLRIDRNRIYGEFFDLFMRKRTFEENREENAIALETGMRSRTKNDFSLKGTGMYAFALVNGEKRAKINCSSREETDWLIGTCNRFINRTKKVSFVRKLSCPFCDADISFKGDTDARNTERLCTNCERCFSFLPPVSDWSDDRLKRPITAKSRIERAENELSLIREPRIDEEFGLRGRLIARFVFAVLFLGIFTFLMFLIIPGTINMVKLFFQVFEPLKALLMCVFCGSVFCLMVLGLYIYVKIIADILFSGWKITISHSLITVTHTTFFGCKTKEYPRPTDLKAKKQEPDIMGFNPRKWLSFRYWTDSDHAWSRNHIRLETNPPIPFPSNDPEEETWLLAVIEDYLRSTD